eukprot:gene7984-9379_t
MYTSTLKFVLYALLLVVGFAIYQSNFIGPQVGTFEPLWASLHKNGASINRTLILAHRGSRYIMPENTILAFRTALELGTDVIETDVRLTKDGHLIVVHDRPLLRTTGLPGDIEDHTLVQLQKVDAGYMYRYDNSTVYPFRAKDIRIPLARQIFDELPHDTPLNIEIKEDDTKVADALWAEIERAMTQGRPTRSVVVSCRYCAPTAHIRTLATAYAVRHNLTALPIATSACEKEATRFILLAHAGLARAYFRWFPAGVESFEVFQIPPQSGPISLDNPRVIQAAHAFGKHVHYWVINNPAEIQRMLTLGIEGVITDRPDLAIKIFQQAGLKPRNLLLPKPLPGNKTGTYYIPMEDTQELHTCITLTCIILQRIHHVIIALVLAYVVMRVLRKPNPPAVAARRRV